MKSINSSTENQRQRIVAILEKNPMNSIAFRELGYLGITSRIAELRKRGYLINSRWIEYISVVDTRHKIVEYALIKKPKKEEKKKW